LQDGADYENIPKERIFISHNPRAKGTQDVDQWDTNVHLYYSDDFFKTKKQIQAGGNSF